MSREDLPASLRVAVVGWDGEHSRLGLPLPETLDGLLRTFTHLTGLRPPPPPSLASPLTHTASTHASAYDINDNDLYDVGVEQLASLISAVRRLRLSAASELIVVHHRSSPPASSTERLKAVVRSAVDGRDDRHAAAAA